jgi:hypothetical protein
MIESLVAYYSWKMFCIEPRTFHVGFVLDKLIVEQVYIQEFRFCFSLLSSHRNMKSDDAKPRTSAHTTDVKHALSRQQTCLTQGKEPGRQATYKVHCAYGLTP